MTVPQFKAWLDEHVLYLGSLDEFRNESEVVEQICDEGYRHAVELNLTDCITAWRPGVVGLMAMRDAIPDPDLLNMEEAAEYLKMSVSGLRKVINRKPSPIDYIQNCKGGHIKFTIEALENYLQCGQESENTPARAYRKPVEPLEGFDTSLI